MGSIKAIIAPKAGATIDQQEIVEYLKARLSHFKRPRILQLADELPKMGSGKLDRVKIKMLYGSPERAGRQTHRTTG